jgi:uncharacterized protein YunC (DUF1805 family)
MSENTAFSTSQAQKDGTALVSLIEQEGHGAPIGKLSIDVQTDLINTAVAMHGTDSAAQLASAHFADITNAVNGHLVGDLKMISPISYTSAQADKPSLWGLNFERTHIAANADANVFLDLDSGKLRDESGGSYNVQIKGGKIAFVKEVPPAPGGRAKAKDPLKK